MKTNLKTTVVVSLMSLTLTCGASEIFVFLVQDKNSTNLITTWCGHPLSPEQFQQKISQVGKVANINKFRFPIRFTPETTFRELFSVVDVFHVSGITNISLQMVSNPVPGEEAVKNKKTVFFEDYSRERPIIIPGFIYRATSGTGARKPSVPIDRGSEKVEPDSEEDIQVDTGGL